MEGHSDPASPPACWCHCPCCAPPGSVSPGSVTDYSSDSESSEVTAGGSTDPASPPSPWGSCSLCAPPGPVSPGSVTDYSSDSETSEPSMESSSDSETSELSVVGNNHPAFSPYPGCDCLRCAPPGPVSAQPFMPYVINHETLNMEWSINGVRMWTAPFCIELTAENPIYTFREQEEDEEDEDHYKTQLALDFALLRSHDDDEDNVVELGIYNENEERVILPLANLRRSSQYFVPLDQFILDPPVTFCLTVGTGAVEILGLIVMKLQDVRHPESNEE